MQVAAGHHQLVADPQTPAHHGLTTRVERLSQRLVQGVDPQLAAVHRSENLDVVDRIEAVVPRQSLDHQRDDLLARLERVEPLDHEQVAAHLG